MKSLKDLARELGVSTTVVSYVYHGKWKEKRIGEALALRVKMALEREGCRPSHAGIQLKTGRSMTVGVLLPDFGMPYGMDIMKGVESVMTPAGLMMLIASTRKGVAERSAMESVLSRGVDGLIMSPFLDEAGFKEAFPSGKGGAPLVFVDNYLKGSKVDYVVSDNRAGAFELVEALLSAGRRRVAYVGRSPLGLSATQERYQGYQDALKGFGMRFDESLVCGEASHENFDRLLSLKRPPDAIFVESLLYFKRGFEALSLRKVKVPSEIMLAGFDTFDSNNVDGGRIDTRSIMRAEQNGEEIGRLAALRLKEMISGGTDARSPRLELRVPAKVRASARGDAP